MLCRKEFLYSFSLDTSDVSIITENEKKKKLKASYQPPQANNFKVGSLSWEIEAFIIQVFLFIVEVKTNCMHTQIGHSTRNSIFFVT
jgi:hypothetical protein